MKTLSGPEKGALMTRLTVATAKGPVVEWVQRIANIASSAGLNLSSIGWNQAPINVAFEVVDSANRAGKVEQLEAAIANLEQQVS